MPALLMQPKNRMTIPIGATDQGSSRLVLIVGEQGDTYETLF